MKLIMAWGVPASGKSTFARTLDYTIVSKDVIRAAMPNYRHPRDEGAVIKEQDRQIVAAMQSGQSVFVDDTNLNPIHELRLRAIAEQYGASFEIKRFTVDHVQVAIDRDLKRERRVGESVIRQMWSKYIRPTLPTYINHDGEPVILVDLDGTLACMGDRSPYSTNVLGDTLNSPVASVTRQFNHIFVSGRQEAARTNTELWLQQHGFNAPLLMRANKDSRPDWIIKREIYLTQIYPRYHVLFCLDDRQQVVDMYRDLGLTVMQVNDGRF